MVSTVHALLSKILAEAGVSNHIEGAPALTSLAEGAFNKLYTIPASGGGDGRVTTSPPFYEIASELGMPRAHICPDPMGHRTQRYHGLDLSRS